MMDYKKGNEIVMERRKDNDEDDLNEFRKDGRRVSGSGDFSLYIDVFTIPLFRPPDENQQGASRAAQRVV